MTWTWAEAFVEQHASLSKEQFLRAVP